MTSEAPAAPAASAVPAAPSTSPEPGSFGEFLKQRRQELQQEKRATIPVPGFDGRVIGEYVSRDWHSTRETALKYRNVGKPGSEAEAEELSANAEFIIGSCTRLYGVGSNGTPDDLPLWGVELARKFGVDVENGGYPLNDRQAVVAIFEGYEENLMQHAAQIVRATAKAGEEVEEELGEA